ncbi:MAG TPA: DUF397 domain-containing protein [Pseudonocardiaceae bacterium]
MSSSDMSFVTWRKSRRSQPNGSCVELGTDGTRWLGFRDSKNPTGPVLLFTREQVTRFLGAVRTGRFDLR